MRRKKGVNRVNLGVEQAREHSERAYAIGYTVQEARIIDAALCGYQYSKRAKTLNIPERLRFSAARRS